MSQYEDITQIGYSNYRDLLDMNNEEYEDIQNYLGMYSKTKKSISDKERMKLINRQRQIENELMLLKNGIIPASRLNYNFNQYNPTDYNLEPQPYMTSMAETSTPFGKSRYDKYAQGDYDIENLLDVRAFNQSGFNKLMAGTGKAAVLAGTTLIDGTVGLLYGLGASTAGWIQGDSFQQGLAKMFNNELSNGLHDINQFVETALPNYRSQYEESRKWYKNMGTANFWADFIKQLGFTVGAMYSGLAWTKALGAAGAINSAMGARIVGSTLSAVNEARIEANNNSDDWRKSQLDRINYELQNEANKIMNNYYNGNISDIEANDLLEQIYKNRDLLEYTVTLRANNVGVMDMLLNIPILAINDYFMFGKAYSRGFNNANKNQLGKRTFKDIWKSANELFGLIESDVAQNTVVEGGKYIYKPISKGKAIAKGSVGFFREGHEEVALAFASELSKNYYTPDSPDAYNEALYNPNAIENTKNFYKSLVEGFSSTYGNIDTYQEFLMGGLNGLLGTFTFGRSLNRGDNVWAGKNKPIGITGGLVGSIMEANAINRQGEEAVKFINDYIDKYNEGLKNGLRHFVASDHFSDLMNGWAEESNAFEYKNAEDNDDFEAIVRFNSVGKLDDFKKLVNQDYENMSDEELDKIAKFTTNNQQWKNIDGTYLSETEEGRKFMRKELSYKRDKLLTEIDSFEKTYESISNMTNDDLGYDKTLELSWLKWKIDRFSVRFKNIKSENYGLLSNIKRGALDILEGVDDSETGKKYEKAAKNLILLIDYINDSETPLEMARKLGANYKAVNALQDKDTYDFFAFNSPLSYDSYKIAMLDLVDAAKIGKLAELFDNRFKEYMEKPEKMDSARKKVEKKYNDIKNNIEAKKAVNTVNNSSEQDVAVMINNLELMKDDDGDIVTQDGNKITKNLSEDEKKDLNDKFNKANEIKKTKDRVIAEIEKDVDVAKQLDISPAEKDIIIRLLLISFDNKEMEVFFPDSHAELDIIMPNETGTVLDLELLNEKRNTYINSIVAIANQKKNNSDERLKNTPEVNTEELVENAKEDESTGHDGVTPTKQVSDEDSKTNTKELSFSSQDIQLNDVDSLVNNELNKKDLPDVYDNKWKPQLTLYPLSQFIERYKEFKTFNSENKYYKIIKENPTKYGFDENSIEYKYIVNVGEYLDNANAFENRYKNTITKDSEIHFAIDPNLNSKVDNQPVILIYDKTNQNIIGSLPLLNTKGNTLDLNDFIEYCISKFQDLDTNDGLIYFIKDNNGDYIKSFVDNNYIGKIPYTDKYIGILDVFNNNYEKIRFGVTKEFGENIPIYTKKSDVFDDNVRFAGRALQGLPFLLLQTSSGREVTVPIYTKRYSNNTRTLEDGTLTFFDKEVQRLVEYIVNTSNNKKMTESLRRSMMDDLNSLFSSQDFYINVNENTKQIDYILIGGNNPNTTEATKKYLYQSSGVNGTINPLTKESLMNQILSYEMPINYDLNRINSDNDDDMIGGVRYNIAIALMAQVKLPKGFIHTIDDFFTFKPVIDGKVVELKSDRYESSYENSQNIYIAQDGVTKIDYVSWSYIGLDGIIHEIEDDSNDFINNNDKSAEKRILDRAKLYVVKRAINKENNQDKIIHLKMGQENRIDYDIINQKLIIPLQPTIKKENTDIPASPVLGGEPINIDLVDEINQSEVEINQPVNDYSSIDVQEVNDWANEELALFIGNRLEIWDNISDDQKRKIYSVRDSIDVNDILDEIDAFGESKSLNTIINGELYRKVDDGISEESIKQNELDWLKQTYPELSSNERLRIVNGLIKVRNSKDNEYAWGMFKNGIIYLSNRAANGTIYHEAFHSVVHNLMSDREFNRMLNRVRKLHKNLSNIELEEILAEDFRGYMQTNVSEHKDNFIQRIFRLLKNIIKGLFDKQYLLNNTYYRISQGIYNNRQIRNINYDIEYYRKNQSYESYKISTMRDIQHLINNIGNIIVGSEVIKQLVTGKNKFRDKLFDTTRYFINLATQFNSDYNPNNPYDTTDTNTRYNQDVVLREVEKRIEDLGLDGFVYIDRNEFGAYEMFGIDDAFNLTYESIYTRLLKLQKSNSIALDYFDLSGETNTSDFLDKIINENTRIGFIALTLKDKLNKNTDVKVLLVTPERMREINKTSATNPDGLFDNDSNTIYINNDTRRPDRTFLHELVHAFVYNSKKSPAKLKRISDIYNDVVNQIENQYGKTKDELIKENPNRFYGLTNVDEFLSEAFTNGFFMREIAYLDLLTEKKVSLIDRFTNWVMSVLGINKTSKAFDDTMLFIKEMLVDLYNDVSFEESRASYLNYMDNYYNSEEYYNEILLMRHESYMYENLSLERIQYLNDKLISKQSYDLMNDDEKEQLFVCMH